MHLKLIGSIIKLGTHFLDKNVLLLSNIRGTMSEDKTLAFLSGEETSNCDLHSELTLRPDFQQEASEGKGGTEGGNERTMEKMGVIRLFYAHSN